MVTADTPLPEMCHWLMPPTADFLDHQPADAQIETLVALREWMCKREDELELVDIFDLSGMIDQFVRNFVRAYKEIR